MLKKCALLVFMQCLVLTSVFFWSLPCEAGWIKIYGGSRNEYTSGVKQTTDGGYIAAGITFSYGYGGDGWIIKMDGSGYATWQKTYGGADRDYINSIQQTTDGGYIAAGEYGFLSAGSGDIWAMKLDESGNVTWQKTYGGTDRDVARSIQQTADGGYIVAGSTVSFGSGDYDWWMLKLDGGGNVTWQKTYGGTQYDFAYSVQQTADGGYIVAGQTDSFGAGGYDAWIMKLEGNGNITWQKTYGGTGYDSISYVQQTLDGGYIVAGQTDSFGAGGYDAWIMKLDGNGNITWQKTYGGTVSDYFGSIRQTADGGYIITGETSSFGAGDSDAWIMKLDGNGNITWQKTYGGTDYDYGHIIHQTVDGGYIMAGGTASLYSGHSAIWFLKLDENGSTGSCPYEGISTTIVSNTTATVIETTAVTGTTSVSGIDTTVIPADSSATPTEICPLSNNPLTLKVGATRKRQGDGAIASSDGLIDCPGTCQAVYNQEATVTLTATPSALSTFMGWKPASLACEGVDPCLLTMDKKKSVKAIFQGPNKLKVVTTFKNGATGTVTSGDALINCPGDCEELYILNAPVTLTANEGVGSKFVKWTGKPCKDQQTNVCTFTMEKNATVKAIFAPTS